MPEKQPTKAEQRKAAREQKALDQLRKEASIRRNRRILIGGIVATAAVGLGGLGSLLAPKFQTPEKPPVKDIITEPFELKKVPSVSYNVTTTGNFSLEATRSLNFDRKYLEDLIQTADTLTARNKRNSVINNLALVRTNVPGGYYSTSALMIDESGIYLTCGHTFIEEKIDEEKSTPENPVLYFKSLDLPATVTNPQLMKRYPVVGYLSDPKTELALFYAPTGFKVRKVPGVSLDSSELQIGDELWQTALYTSNNYPILNVMYGKTVGYEQDLEPNLKSGNRESRMRVEGMIPFGGSSGAPIIDQQGVVRAVESGFFVNPITDKSKQIARADYVGSTVAPLKRLKDILDNQEFVKLPL